MDQSEFIGAFIIIMMVVLLPTILRQAKYAFFMVRDLDWSSRHIQQEMEEESPAQPPLSVKEAGLIPIEGQNMQLLKLYESNRRLFFVTVSGMLSLFYRRYDRRDEHISNNAFVLNQKQDKPWDQIDGLTKAEYQFLLRLLAHAGVIGRFEHDPKEIVIIRAHCLRKKEIEIQDADPIFVLEGGMVRVWDYLEEYWECLPDLLFTGNYKFEDIPLYNLETYE